MILLKILNLNFEVQKRRFSLKVVCRVMNVSLIDKNNLKAFAIFKVKGFRDFITKYSRIGKVFYMNIYFFVLKKIW